MEEVGVRLWELHQRLAPPLPRGEVPLSPLLTRKGPNSQQSLTQPLACILKFPRNDLLWFCLRPRALSRTG